jgi:hypothetical protein
LFFPRNLRPPVTSPTGASAPAASATAPPDPMTLMLHHATDKTRRAPEQTNHHRYDRPDRTYPNARIGRPAATRPTRQHSPDGDQRGDVPYPGRLPVA